MKKGNDYRYKFSIITAVYNVKNYLEDAIESILSQDIGFHDSVELILVDDGSTDGSAAICDVYKEKYPDNIKVIHKENGGVSAARNEGILHAEGRYVNFMDSDDKLSPDTLSEVYRYFSRVDHEIDLVSIPIYLFEGKELSHRLNYKFQSRYNLIIDLWKQYSYVQMSAASAFFKREVLTPDFFDVTLLYAEDAKAIMGLFFEKSRYGIVPKGRYYYRFRNTMDSALNGSKQHKEWYLDCLKKYILWAAKEALAKFGFVPKFVQYTIMYDLQSRFRLEALPEGILTQEEEKEFMDLLSEALSYIDNRIILEQKNLSKEQKDYIISLKKDSGSAIYEYFNEDARIRYGDTVTDSLSSYVLKLQKPDFSSEEVRISGSVKLNCKFPYPSEIYVQLTNKETTETIPCSFEKNPDRAFCFAGAILAQFTDFRVSFPRSLIKGNTKIEFCMTCNSHTVRFRNLLPEKDFPIPESESQVYLPKQRLILKKSQQNLVLEPVGFKRHVVLQSRFYLSGSENKKRLK